MTSTVALHNNPPQDLHYNLARWRNTTRITALLYCQLRLVHRYIILMTHHGYNVEISTGAVIRTNYTSTPLWASPDCLRASLTSAQHARLALSLKPSIMRGQTCQHVSGSSWASKYKWGERNIRDSDKVVFSLE